MRETCPLIEAAIPADVMAEPSVWTKAGAELRELSSSGDAETKNAIDILLPAIDALAADPAPGADALAAFDGLTTAIRTMADRCEAVGSSALQ
ncbi:hypothetical protein EFK50_00935 [Nocardioides marmoriginsengisoli]|uniref:Uncharacterized protein n=1 Tax=Nocardioides marmoriginsengisoli TaxID=661483 RepID=A0A3N0CSH2_9ACTN|nr:hypothetical protein EFK50_00935 [Nocardioides marmoriginsengisoli]